MSNKPKEKMSDEKRAILLNVLTLFNSGTATEEELEEAMALAKKHIPAEKWMERALGRKYLEENGWDTSELD
ncbi:MAG: hypothetical protein LBV09_03255 [Deferribacteraceae bacterium]|jgi:ribonuclease PH|nr:hypothetical protein [Deferribacteraceae bacterium]